MTALASTADTAAAPIEDAHGIIARPRLVAELERAGAGHLAVLAAPAGYGKTTLLRQWEAVGGRPFARLDLDARDDDRARLLARITRALRGRRSADRLVLALDDAHVLRSAGARRQLEEIATDLPAGATLALVTRGDAPLPLARARAQRRLVELGPEQLAMTRDETAALLALDGRRPAARELDALVRLTEGWPAGVSLALLALEDGRPADHLGGAEPLFADFLCDEILGALTAADRAFLRRTSVLDELSGPACDATLRRTGSAAVLARLARAHVLLLPLDRRGERFRCHRLLRGALTAELRRLEPGLAADLHRRASGWLRRADDLDGAVAHALAGGDPQRAATLVWASAAAAVTHGGTADVTRRLDTFTPLQIATIAPLGLAAASTQLMAGRGDLASHWASAAAVAAPADAPATVFGGLAAVRAGLGHDGLRQIVEDSARARDLAPDDGPCGALCRLAAGAALHLLGDREQATAELVAGARLAAVSAPALHALCLAQLGILALDRDDRDEAAELLARAHAQVDRHGLGDSPACALVFAAAALVRAQTGRADDARRDLAHATRLQAELVDFAPWYDAELRILSGRAAWRLCDVVDASARLHDARRYVRRVPEATVLTDWLDESEAQLAAATAPTAAPPASLTTAELRVLGYLPTHLSFREIAEQTFVSANTVKTQANAVYRKLDVSSRSEAVARARELGVLDRA